MPSYAPITSLAPTQVAQLHQLYQYEWWTQGRELADVQTMVQHSDYLFGFCEATSGQLVAFARVLSDRVYRAIVFDVIVAADHRQQGLGTRLLHQIIDHPELAAMECILLFCLPEMMPFYEKIGFIPAKQLIMARASMPSLRLNKP